MDYERARLIARLTTAVAGLGYLLVFLVAVGTGADAETALLKGLAAMVCLGIFGRLVLPIVASTGRAQVGPPGGGERTQEIRLDVGVAAAPDELSGETR